MTREEEWLVEYRVLRGLSQDIVAARNRNDLVEVARLRTRFAAQIEKMKALSNQAERQQLSSFEHLLLDIEQSVQNAVPATAGFAGETLAALLKPLVPVLIVVGVAALLIYGGAIRKGLH